MEAPGGRGLHEGFRDQPGRLQHLRLPDEGEHPVVKTRGVRGKEKLSKKCVCPTGAVHQSLVGKMLTEASAEYPRELCELYATFVVKAWKKTLQLEWRREREMLRTRKSEVSELQVKWLRTKEKQHCAPPVPSRAVSKRAWTQAQAGEDMGPAKKISKKTAREMDNERAIGGMRNPHSALKRLTKVAEVGKDIARLWRRFAVNNPRVLEVAKAYGSQECGPDEEIARRWKEELKEFLKVTTSKEIVLKEKIEFRSPLDADMWAAWQRKSADPERHLAEWARQGAPLGMSCAIPESNGVFPKTEDSADLEEAPALELQAKLKNYTSVYEDLEGAGEELGRYLDKGFARRMPTDKAAERFGSGTVSRLALITKVKDQGVIKRRIVIDLLRSGGNARARVPERIVLPRGVDVTSMIKRAWKLREVRRQEHDPLDDWDRRTARRTTTSS